MFKTNAAFWHFPGSVNTFWTHDKGQDLKDAYANVKEKSSELVCVFLNIFSSFSAFYLFTLVPPTIRPGETTAVLQVDQRDNATLVCSASGIPAPNITWTKSDGGFLATGQAQHRVSLQFWLKSWYFEYNTLDIQLCAYIHTCFYIACTFYFHLMHALAYMTTRRITKHFSQLYITESVILLIRVCSQYLDISCPTCRPA